MSSSWVALPRTRLMPLQRRLAALAQHDPARVFQKVEKPIHAVALPLTRQNPLQLLPEKFPGTKSVKVHPGQGASHVLERTHYRHLAAAC